VKRLALCAVLALCVVLPARAADPAGPAAKRWKQADTCIADANKQVPDHNAAALRKRDELTNACMTAHGLPPLTKVAPADDAPPTPSTAPSN